MTVVVIGAGLGGLSAACHLAGRGHEVVVLEREDVPGGRAGIWETNGYRFDTGPSVLTMTGLLSDVFSAAGADMADHLTLHPVDPTYRASFPDGSTISCRHGVDAMRAEIADQCGSREAEGFDRFVGWITKLYELEMPHFIDRNFDSPLGMARPASPVIRLLRSGGLRRLSSAVGNYFEDERLQRLFSFQAMYAGLSPFDALAIYAVITYMDSVAGVYFPEGGMHSVSRGLAAAAEKAGATFRYGTTVERIVRAPGTGAVTGVRTAEGELITASAVVANPDLPVAYRELLPNLDPPKVAVRGEYSPSCAVWIGGVKGDLPPGTAHHNIHFGSQWREAFQALLKDGRPMPDPSILVTSATVGDPSLAPPNRHSLYVLEPMPNLDGRIDWLREGDALRQRLLRQVGGLGYPTDETSIEVERFVDPLEWQRRGMERGTPFALSHRFFQTGPFRPGNVDPRAPGLTFVGSGTVPGVGVPIVLLSGRLAADRVDELLERSGKSARRS